MKRKLAVLLAVFALATAALAMPVASAGGHLQGEMDITLETTFCMKALNQALFERRCEIFNDTSSSAGLKSPTQKASYGHPLLSNRRSESGPIVSLS